jgi:flavin reductase (DIM6/NTAB) family NADH-FMN oxidoreductase RutF
MGHVRLDTSGPVWDRFFIVAPLVLVGTRDADGSLDLAPKHMAMPMGWQNYFGFMCSPSHGTAANIERNGEFTVSYPKPQQVLETSLAASPRSEGQKPVLDLYATFPAEVVDGEFIEDAYLFLECRHYRTYADFGDNCLITGEIVARTRGPGLPALQRTRQHGSPPRASAARLRVAGTFRVDRPDQRVSVPGRYEEVNDHGCVSCHARSRSRLR